MGDVEAEADRLYGLRPQEFVAERDGAARHARAAGDRELAAELAALRKPTVSAWLTNLLVRDDASLAPQLLALGDGLRAAESSLDGAQLRDLNRQRRALVGSLVVRARRLASAAGQRVGDAVVQELDRTLMAALADPQVAAEVLSGRLTGPREHIGFGAATAGGQHLTVVPDADAVTLARSSRAAARPRTPPGDRTRLTLAQPEESTALRREREREQARAAAEAAARQELDRARSVLQGAQDRQRSADAAATDAEAALEEWREMTASARSDVTRTERELRKLAAALEGAKARLGDAERKESRAKDSLTAARLQTRDAGSAVRTAREAVTKAARSAERRRPPG